MDLAFEPGEEREPQVEISATAAQEHVAEAEQCVRLAKEKKAGHYK